MFFTEGGAQGHLQHLYDDPDLTFREIKEVFVKAAQGELEGTEKTDGQNLLLSFDVKTQTPVAARNKGNIKNGGLNAQELAQKFAGRDALETAFNDAFEAWSDVVTSLPKEKQVEIFGPSADIWFNAEVQDPGNPNVINYDQRNLVLHQAGHAEFDRETGKVTTTDVSKNAALLSQLIDAQQTAQDPQKFRVVNNAIRRLQALDDKEVLNQTLSRLEKEIDKWGISDNQTIGDYLRIKIYSLMNKELPNASTEQKDAIILKALGEKGITKKQLTKDLPPDQAEKALLLAQPKVVSFVIRPIENIVHDFAVEILKTLHSVFILNNEKEVRRLRDEVAKAIATIEASKNKDALVILQKQLSKLKSVENISTAVEGFVFSHKGKTYKFTGNFAPVNQLLGLFKFGRGKVPPLKKMDEINKAKKKKVVALFPGGFKPPHAGHYVIAEALAEEPEVNVVKILISPKPRENITAEQSKKIWDIFTQDNKKIEAQVSQNPSPVAAVYDFIEQQTQKGDQVLLAVGEKDQGSSRFKSVDKFIEKNKLGISFKEVVVPNVKLSGKVLSATTMRKAIEEGDEETFLSGMPDHLSPEQLADVWDVASERLNEMSAMGAGAVAGAAAPFPNKKKEWKINENEVKKIMIDRHKLLEEIKLRKHIQSLLNKIHVDKIFEELELRSAVRSLIKEAQSDVAENPHESTGINVLADLLKKIIPQLETGYKTLTTKKEQRDSFRKHILNATQKILTTADINDKAGELGVAELTENFEIDEEIDVVVGDEDVEPQPGDDEKFIDIDQKSDEEDEEKDTFSLPGEDETGRNMARSTFESIENQIVDAYNVLENEEDQKLFYDYLLTNLRLYFDKFETELEPSVDETNVEAEDAEITDEEPAAEEEDDLDLGLDDEM